MTQAAHPFRAGAPANADPAFARGLAKLVKLLARQAAAGSHAQSSRKDMADGGTQ